MDRNPHDYALDVSGTSRHQSYRKKYRQNHPHCALVADKGQHLVLQCEH
ncbi:Uncharacterised protein [Vibrio cholerae]|uniref:Uncharacterized protein n=1 Tax=Vibrio cholerae TaxID=666 RepID=A0A655PKJ4_VIBCL|nr:Uncharacterised protein [Vibrio cholerae]